MAENVSWPPSLIGSISFPFFLSVLGAFSFARRRWLIGRGRNSWRPFIRSVREPERYTDCVPVWVGSATRVLTKINSENSFFFHCTIFFFNFRDRFHSIRVARVGRDWSLEPNTQSGRRARPDVVFAFVNRHETKSY